MNDLIERLRDWASEPACYEVPPPSLLLASADALEAQAKRIEELVAERDAWKAEADMLDGTMAGEFAKVVGTIWANNPDASIRETLDELNRIFPSQPAAQEKP